MSLAAALLLLAQAGGSDVAKATSDALVCDSPLDHPEVTVCAAGEDEHDECDNPTTQDVPERCALADFEATEAVMTSQWEETVAEMKRLDAAREAGDTQPGYYETLLEAQHAWVQYRDAECRSESFLVRGAPAQRTIELQCKTYHTQVRTQELSILVSGLDL